MHNLCQISFFGGTFMKLHESKQKGRILFRPGEYADTRNDRQRMNKGG